MATPEHEDNLAMSVYIVDYHYDSEKLSLKMPNPPAAPRIYASFERFRNCAFYR